MSSRHDGFRAILCLSTAAMMAVSWPLWVSGGLFPRVPFVGGLRLLPVWASWMRFVVAIGAMCAAAMWPWIRSRFQGKILPEPRCGAGSSSTEAGIRIALGLALILSAWMVLEDQFRLQPWMYQFLLMGLVLVACPSSLALTLCQWMVIAIYFHSGLSKLDQSFMEYTGRSFLHYLARPFGIDTGSWPNDVRNRAALLIPCWEIGVASALAVKARRLGIIGAVVQHVGLLIILGPWGLEHSTNVLIWNVAMALEVVFLFGSNRPAIRSADPPTRFGQAFSSLAAGLIVVACIMPFGERWGWWDTWPSFGLYEASNETGTIYVTPKKGPSFEVRSTSEGQVTIRFDGQKIDLARMSLEERRVPLYPSARTLNGVAEAFAKRSENDRTVYVHHVGRANRITGQRIEMDVIGLDDIRRHGDSFWINAHPAP